MQLKIHFYDTLGDVNNGMYEDSLALVHKLFPILQLNKLKRNSLFDDELRRKKPDSSILFVSFIAFVWFIIELSVLFITFRKLFRIIFTN